MSDTDTNSNEKSRNLPKFHNKGGPHDLGDPDDQRIRNVEREVLIPMKMREKAKAEKCFDLVSSFQDCCSQNSLLMVVYCRKENTAMKDCMQKWYTNEEFRKECEEEYLRERSEYRRTGIKTKETKKKARVI